MEPVLLALGQPDQLSKDVQRFLRVLIIGAPGYIAFESLKKYLQCQGNPLVGYPGQWLILYRNHEGVDSSPDPRISC